MNQNKKLIYSLVVASGLVLVWTIYADQGVDLKPDIVEDETPLILVDGKVPPRLSNFVMHMQFIDENTCLKCHKEEREMDFGSGPVTAKKMTHEMRENCVSCHLLPK
ncbi:MAG: hypothetical protein HN927_09285 [Candidatus Marinimicrobia bacterium]|jgi:hypothetical protein|nr:hypothetical protein [Candidatus Neomarinimicrobiota bacterium]MBT3947690.1 hypothetical protein [Candidatus Neomarinimicrobiota bacterium]MBT4064718.1 hypothetical protein [Candidatus Neomarinimicrobiota bacterium]MBT4307237.1 hypothetical protein [Candidatus Neomarinimicrobiota bacterium]MBT4453634.1 hypothetical protein [Candidatus Neomarinimicrobiota bacterium]|tara:strand:+ start:1457 stop:1777 length:321 start_codon:yes stop_codon:yes gene_type:complete